MEPIWAEMPMIGKGKRHEYRGPTETLIQAAGVALLLDLYRPRINPGAFANVGLSELKRFGVVGSIGP